MIDVAQRPRFTATDTEELAQERYGLRGTASEMRSERDQNFLLTVADGRQFVLKIANEGEKRESLEFQNQVLGRLTEHRVPFPIPQVLTSKAGNEIENLSGKNGNHYHCRLLTYLPGIPLAESSSLEPELLESLGRLLGLIDGALTGYGHQAAHRSFQWNLGQAREVIDRNSRYVTSPKRQRLLSRFLSRFENDVLPNLRELRSGVIHNDGNSDNVLVSTGDSGAVEITGLLDFGDMVYAPYAYEPAVAAAYVMMDSADPLAVAARVLFGYQEAFPLTAGELALIFDLICVRLCVSVSLAAGQRNREPGNRYLTISERSAWSLLEQLADLDHHAASHRLLLECRAPAKVSGWEQAQEQILTLRKRYLGSSLSISYKRPLHIVRGRGQYLYDRAGREYLDAVNNVPHVGHCHPKVVEAGQIQMALLNTNTRYLHEAVVHYAQRLCATLPEPLSVCYFVCSGSEANELALRLARTATGQKDIICLDGAYHGNSSALIEISPYKFDGPGGQGPPEFVHKVIMPDTFRGPYRATDPEASSKYATHVASVIDRLGDAGVGLAAFISEPLLGCGGQICPPVGYLPAVYELVRQAGGICIADEVQTGFGRVGTHFWAFQSQGAIPDIVTIGKPMGNGHPVAAVVTTPEIARLFDNGMEYFNTYGGNPVSCAIGMAVLDVIEDESLQQHALRVGSRLKDGLESLKSDYELIGDVRGSGLFLGVELVRDRAELTPADTEAAEIVERMKDKGILISTDGPWHNVLKIKPPMVFSEENADYFARSLQEILSEGLESQM